MTLDRALSDFTVELDVYSGPYEWLLALILKEELEIFEVPLRELVTLYVQARDPEAPNALERDTDFAGSAAARRPCASGSEQTRATTRRPTSCRRGRAACG